MISHIENSFSSKRFFIILCILATISVVLCFQLYRYTILERDHFLQYANQIIWREGIIPSPRGSIYDCNNICLVWSVRTHSFILNQNPQKKHIAQIIKKCETILGPISPLPINEHFWILRDQLSPSELAWIQSEIISSSSQFFSIQSQMSRCYISNHPNFRHFIGEVDVTIHGSQLGISGIEKKFNSHLTGTNGIYRVKVNYKQDFVPGSWTDVQKLKPGNSLKLKYSLQEIIENPTLLNSVES